MKVSVTLLAIASVCLATASPRLGDIFGVGKGELAPQVVVKINDNETVKVKLQDSQGGAKLGSGGRGRSSFTNIESATIASGPMGVECFFTATQQPPTPPQLSGRFTKWDPFTLTFSADRLWCFVPHIDVVRVIVNPPVRKNRLLAVELAPNGRGETSLGPEDKTFPINNAFIVDGPSVKCSVIYERNGSQGRGQYLQSSFTNSRPLYGNLQKSSHLHCERRTNGRASFSPWNR